MCDETLTGQIGFFNEKEELFLFSYNCKFKYFGNLLWSWYLFY